MANSPRILVDTGPLVAFLRAEEAAHAWAVARFRELPAPFFTCDPVLAETFFLVFRDPGGTDRFFELIDSGLLQADFSVMEERTALGKLIRKYRDLPMSLADACLVRSAELHPDAAVFTLDRYFRIYRKHGRQHLPVIMPE